MLCTYHNFDRTISLHHDGRSKFSLFLNISSLICLYTYVHICRKYIKDYYYYRLDSKNKINILDHQPFLMETLR